MKFGASMLYALRLDEELVNVTITNALPSKSLVRETDRQTGRQAGRHHHPAGVCNPQPTVAMNETQHKLT